MKTNMSYQKLLVCVYALAVIWFCHHFIFRPIILDWGSPEPVRELPLTGDVFTQGSSHTRAVLVEATPAELWAWLIQVGQERGGFYSYQWLENLVGADMRNVYDIRAEFQRLRQPGDTVWLASKHHYKGEGYQIVAEINPLRSLVMVGGDDYERIQKGQQARGSWAFYLYPESESKTWLIARSSSGDIGFGNKLLRYCTYEVPHYIMERKMLVTIKKLAERRHRENTAI